MNVVIKLMVKYLVGLIRYHDNGDSIEHKMFNIFFNQYLNTAFLLLAIGLDYKKFGYHILKASSNDFGLRWYTEIGRMIVITMSINSLMPFFNFATLWV